MDSKTKSSNKYLKGISWILNPVFWLWVAPLLLIAPNIALTVTEYNSVWAKITNIALPLGIYGILFSLFRKIGRTILLFIPIMVFASLQIVLLALYGESIIAIDMYVNILTTSVSEAKELLENLFWAILVILVLYLPLLSFGIYARIKKVYAPIGPRQLLRKLSYFPLGLGVISFIFAIIFADDFMPRREIFPYNVAENLVTAIRRTNTSMHYHNTSDKFTYSSVMMRDKTLPEVYVVVIGETSRAMNWELNGYNRPTNPKLKERQGIFTFPKVVSEINTTHKAVPMLLSYLEPENFGDSVAHTRSIFQAFNNIGYRTAFFSNQSRNHSYIDYYGKEAQFAEFLTDNGAGQKDFDLIAEMNRIIESSPNNKVFIVLHTYGSHFEYRKRYPAEMAYFTPDVNSTAHASNRNQLLNAYDNTIRYTDALLDSIIESLDKLNVPTALLYVSDHGEDIYDDDRERFLHSSPTPTAHQLNVPFIIWLSDEYNAQFPEIANGIKGNLDKNISSTGSLFHTILDVTGIKSPFYDASYSVASPQFRERPRKYLNDYNESVPLWKSGLRDEDFAVFDSLKISYR